MNATNARTQLAHLVEAEPNPLRRMTYVAALAHLDDSHDDPGATQVTGAEASLETCLAAVADLTADPDPFQRSRAVLALQELTTPLPGGAA